MEVHKHCHTLSESSCCSNDTLFNLEELNFAFNDAEKQLEQTAGTSKKSDVKKNLDPGNLLHNDDNNCTDVLNTTFVLEPEYPDTKVMPNHLNSCTETLECSLQQNLNDFLSNERIHTENSYLKIGQESYESFLSNPKNSKLCNESATSSPTKFETSTDVANPQYQDEDNELLSDNCDRNNYQIVNIDYSKYVDLENAKNSIEYDGSQKESPDYNIISDHVTGNEDNMYGMLADIRFSGPTDSQLMSTSFSESNTCDEKEWDSGSDSRSSSSGEFIWKVSNLNIYSTGCYCFQNSTQN